MTETIKASIPSSFVSNNMKIAGDRGAGESKLFVRSVSAESELDNFFEFGAGYTYFISKDNLRDYLLQVKMEYVYHKFNSYKNATLETWNNNLELVEKLETPKVNIDLVKFTDKARYYVRSDSQEFKKLLRSIALPKITDLFFIKDLVTKTIQISLELNLSYNQSNYNYEKTQPLECRTSIDSPSTFESNLECILPRNRIVFGAPGTGKSFQINNELDALLKEFKVNDDNYERVTFHPDYSYANFVGTYKPVMSKPNSQEIMDDSTKEVIKILNDKNKSAQDKYDSICTVLQSDRITVVPFLLGLIGVKAEEFTCQRTKKNDDSVNENKKSTDNRCDNGEALGKYVQLKTLEPKASEISYEYVPGPFMRIYVKALKNVKDVANKKDAPRPFLLIIEEINRAEVAAVFGDVFQLLDRKNNISEYPIQASEDIKKYLAKELGGKPDDYAKIRIPDNMFIWATMNSADQGVYQMDTAFKRRWDFEYIGINNGDKEISDRYVELGANKEQIVWNSLRKAINDYLAKSKINEDKQLGPSFISREIVAPNKSKEIDSSAFAKVFKNKVIMYLFEDAAKQKRHALFSGAGNDCYRYSQICEAFDVKGIRIFCDDVLENYRKIEEERNKQMPSKRDGES